MKWFLIFVVCGGGSSGGPKCDHKPIFVTSTRAECTAILNGEDDRYRFGVDYLLAYCKPEEK